MNTTPTHPFHRDLAEKAKWLIRKASDPNERVTVMKWDCRGERPFAAIVTDGVTDWPELLSEGDLCLSADYSSPAVRAAVQRSHEELGMVIRWRAKGTKPWPAHCTSNNYPPQWVWDMWEYRLAIHLLDPIASEESKKLPEDWCRELNMTVMDPDGWDRKNFEQDWTIPLTRAEFNEKAIRSTTRHDKYIPSHFANENRDNSEICGNCGKPFGKHRCTNNACPDERGYYMYLDTTFTPKPSWSLSRHLSGFRALRDGEQWHRTDWEEEMLPNGWRPCLLGETDEHGDEMLYDNRWILTGTHFPLSAGNFHHRTRRPLPKPPTPRDLTKEDWEAVRELEFKDNLGRLQAWHEIADDGIMFYREFLTHEELRRRGWLYRGNGFGWRKCEKEGK